MVSAKFVLSLLTLSALVGNNIMKTVKLFSMDHPKHGMYYVFYNTENKTFGISRSEYNGETGLWCGYASLAALFETKGF